MTYQHDKLRADKLCPRCFGHKDVGLVLCWPCNREEKRANGGGYSAETEAAIDARDHFLGGNR